MRFGSTTIGGPTPGGVISVAPGSNSAFNVQFAIPGNNASYATETILAGLGGGILIGATITGTAAAANKAIAELNNPNASGVVLYVYAIDLFVPTAMSVNLLIDGTTLAPVGTGINMKAGAGVGAAKVGGGNQLAPTGSLFYSSPSVTANTQYILPYPWICALPSNHNLQLQGQTVNQAFTCNIRWLQLSQ